jgi:hypothetical protein
LPQPWQNSILVHRRRHTAFFLPHHNRPSQAYKFLKFGPQGRAVLLNPLSTGVDFLFAAIR